MTAKDMVVDLIALHGGELVGRTRLQKEGYILNRCGGNFPVSFIYHYYGPYSFDLARGVDDARADGQVVISEAPGSYGIPYTTFKSAGPVECHSEGFGELSRAAAFGLIDIMKRTSDIVLELAATIVFLRDDEGYSDRAIAETIARKPLKAKPHRIAAARKLLKDLGLG